MKRSELTVQAMKDRGFEPCKDYRLKDVVFNIQENEYWKYLQMSTTEEVYVETEYGMCSTYEVRLKREYLEVSADKKTWYPVAYRYKEVSRTCLYAD